VSRYWIASRKREGTGGRKMQHWISRFGQLALEMSPSKSQERLRNEWILSQVEAATTMVKIQFVQKKMGE